jgi:hypothetical protein
LLERLDPETGEHVSTIDVGFPIEELTVGEEGVWVLGESLVQIDPARNTVAQRIQAGRSADSLSLGEGFVWVGSSRDHTVTRVDPGTNDLLTIDVGGRPIATAAGEGGVWVIVRPA